MGSSILRERRMYMLIQCPECEFQVSDKAITCPHCGYPLKNTQISRRSHKKRKTHMRLPNGFGRITKIKNKNLRNPYRVMVTVGKTPEGRPIGKLLKPKAFFSTYNEAYAALVEYHKNPYNIDNSITTLELYERWKKEHLDKCSNSYQRTTKAAWDYCSSVYDIPVMEIRPHHIKFCMNEGYRIESRGKQKGKKVYASAGVKSNIKSLFNILLDYALEYEVVDRNYARAFEVSTDITKEIKRNRKEHIPFTKEEMNILWSNVKSVPFVDLILIQCYMGWRPQELISISLDDVNLEEWYIKGGMKTDAGRQRIVPIHSKIKGLVKQNYESALSLKSEKLFNDRSPNSKSMILTYSKYRNRFSNIIKQLGLSEQHTPHDPRKTFITNGKRAKMDEYALKGMVGHSIQDVTEASYTMRDLEGLREDLEKLS